MDSGNLEKIDAAINCGWSSEYYYISEYLRKKLIGAKVVGIKGGYGNRYQGEIYFDNGMIICFFEDSEGSIIWEKEQNNAL